MSAPVFQLVPVTEAEIARLKYLMRLTPSQMLAQCPLEEYVMLQSRYYAHADAAHQRLFDQELADRKVQWAIHYDYDLALEKMQNEGAVFYLKRTMFLSEINMMLGTVEAWREYIDTYLRVLTEFAEALEDCTEALFADWQKWVLTITETQAKSEARAKHPDLTRVMNKAKRAKNQAKLLMDRLDRQWNTLSRQAKIAEGQAAIGDVLIRTQLSGEE